MELINISYLPKQQHDDLIQVINTKRHPLREELTDLLSELWKVSGVSNICTDCFGGKLPHQRGCCGSCLHRGPTGCYAKPVKCAAFVCFPIQTGKWVDKRVIKLVKAIEKYIMPLSKGFFHVGYARELGSLDFEVVDKYGNYTSPPTLKEDPERAFRCAIRMMRRYVRIFKAKPFKLTRKYKALLVGEGYVQNV